MMDLCVSAPYKATEAFMFLKSNTLPKNFFLLALAPFLFFDYSISAVVFSNSIYLLKLSLISSISLYIDFILLSAASPFFYETSSLF